MVYAVGFEESAGTEVAAVGGKGAHLGELSRIDGVRVPPGFSVTTDAFRRILSQVPEVEERLGLLSRHSPEDRAAIGRESAALRHLLEGIEIPADLAAAITRQIVRLGEQDAWAVRSSARAPRPRTRTRPRSRASRTPT